MHGGSTARAPARSRHSGRWWATAGVALAAALAALVYYVASGAGDCRECPHSWHQDASREAAPYLFVAYFIVQIAAIVETRRLWAKLLGSVLLVFVALFGLLAAWILTIN